MLALESHGDGEGDDAGEAGSVGTSAVVATGSVGNSTTRASSGAVGAPAVGT